MREVDFVALLANWHESEHSGLEARGVSMRFGQSIADRPKTSAWVAAERSGRMVNLQVWSSGEVEFEAGGYGRVDLQEHHELRSGADMDALLGRLVDFLDAG